MSELASSVHPQRLKMDGSSDSICLNCLGTITAKDRADQADAGIQHVCHPSFSSDRSSTTQAAHEML
jgi:hypothetical protein